MWSRGINKEIIFFDDHDRAKLIEILELVLTDAGAYLVTWAILGNHFHLIICVAGTVSLAAIMHRALSWYGTYLRGRHSGAGYVFQNRYGSKVVDSDAYWQTLLAYVNLNPLDAQLVTTLEELAHYRWSGHAALMGERPPLTVHRVADVLYRLGNDSESSRAKLLDLMSRQIDEHGEVKVPDVVRGAMHSQGAAAATAPRPPLRRVSTVEWETALQRLAQRASVPADELCQPLYRRDLVGVRSALVYYGVTRLGMSAAEAGRRLGLSQPASSRALNKGREQLRLLAPELTHDETDLAG